MGLFWMNYCSRWHGDGDIDDWEDFFLNEVILDELYSSDRLYKEIRGNGWVFKEGINKGKLNLFYVKLATGFGDIDIRSRTNRDKEIFIKEVYNPLIGYLLKKGIIKPPLEENLPEYHAAINFIVGNILSPPLGFYDNKPVPQYKKEQEENKRFLKELEDIRDGVGGGKLRKTKRRGKKRKKRKTKRKRIKKK